MHKQQKHKNSHKPGKRGSGGRAMIGHFHAMTQLIGVAGIYPALLVIPPNFPRPAQVVDSYEEYRLKRLRYRIFPVGSQANLSTTAIAYYPTVLTGVPSFSTSYDNPTVLTLLPTEVKPSDWKVVSKAILAGLQPWYKSEAAVLTAADSVPGQIWVTALSISQTTVIGVEVDGAFEYRGEVNPAQTPASLVSLLRQQAQLTERIENRTRQDQLQLADRHKRLMLELSYTEVASEGSIPTKWPLQTSSLPAAQSGSRRQ